MGFFSKNCVGCNKSIAAVYKTKGWRSQAVCISADGTVTQGVYGGYGYIFPDVKSCLAAYGSADRADWHIDYVTEATLWHKACWEIAGRPTDFRGDSPVAQDQGYFFGKNGAVPKPKA